MGIKHKQAFTIVELLVVIVIIGILAAVTIVSYSGISNKAVGASLRSDLTSDAKLLKMYHVEYGYYPSSIGADFCPTTPTADTRYCLRASLDTTLTYTGGNQAFKLKAKKSGQTYYITEGDIAKAATVPIVDYNTATSITATTATIGATIVSDGGDDITAYGMCYGTTPNPTNCVEVEQGALTSLATNNVSTNSVNAVASPDNKSLYSISLNGVINMFNRDASTGALSAMTPATVATSNYHGDGITITSDGKFVYAIGYDASTQASIFVFSRDTSTGVLTAQTALKQDIWSNPRDIEVSPDGKYIYTVGDTSNLYRYTRNTTTGAITSVSGSYNGGTNPQEIAISPDGLHLYTTDYSNDYVRMFRIDQANGNPIALTPAYISAGTSSCAPRGIIVSPDGKNVYVTTYSANLIKMYSRDAGTGLLTALLPTSTIAAGGANPKGITLSSDGKSLYVSLYGAFRVGMFFRNATTGVLTALTPAYITTGTATQAPVLSADGKFLYSPNYTQGNITSYTRSVGTTEGATFTKAITGLVTKTTYYYRGYATNSIGTGYSTDSTFTTL